MNKKVFLLFIFLLFLDIVSAHEIVFNNVLPGSIVEKELELKSESKRNITITGEVKDWVRLNTSNSTLKIYASPPSDAELGEHKVYFKLGKEVVFSPITGAVITEPVVSILINVTRTFVERFEIEQLLMENAQLGKPLRIKLSLNNYGNIPISLRLAGNVLSDDSKPLKSFEKSFSQITGGQNIDEEIAIPHDLGVGEYFANITIFKENAPVHSYFGKFSVMKELPKIEKGKENSFFSVPVAFYVIFGAVIGGIIMYTFCSRLCKFIKNKKTR